MTTENRLAFPSGNGACASRAAREPVAQARDGALFGVGLAATAALLLLFAWPMLEGRVYVSPDLGGYHLPLRHFYRLCLRAGRDFVWAPGIFCGFYLHGEGQVGMYHPLHLVLYRWLALAPAFNLELFLSYPFMLAGAYLWLQRWRLGRGASLFGALVFTFSGFNMLHYMHMNAVAAASHIPWLLLAVDVSLRSGDRRSAAFARLGVGVLTGSQLLLGHPQVVWFSSVAEALYVLFLARSRPDRRRLWLLGLAKALGILAGSVQLLPTWDALSGSERSGASESFRYSGSLHPPNLAQIVGPYLFQRRVYGANTQEYGLYVGALAPVLAAMLLVRRKELGAKRPLAAGAFVLAVLSLVLAMGKHGYLYRLQAQLPLVGSFRCPCRYILLVHLAAGVLAALALADLLSLRESGRRAAWRGLWPLAVPFAASVLIPPAILLWSRARPQSLLAQQLAPWRHVLAGPALVAVATALAVAAARGVRFAPAAIILFAAADQGWYGLSFVRQSPAMDVGTFLQLFKTPPGAEAARLQCLREDQRSNPLIMKGLQLADGYVALTPRKKLEHWHPGRLQVAGVRWLQAERSGVIYWGELRRRAMPRVRLVTRALVNADPDKVIDTVDVEFVALVSEPVYLGGGEPGTATIVRDRPGTVAIRTRADSRQLLVLSESYHRGWQAHVDGARKPVVPVYGDFLGCVVEAGAHEVVFTFAPLHLRVGEWLSLAAMAGMLSCVAPEFIRRRVGTRKK